MNSLLVDDSEALVLLIRDQRRDGDEQLNRQRIDCGAQ
jgi:hypothetical protein